MLMLLRMQVISDFEQRRQRIERLTADTSRLDQELVQHRSETAAVKERWIEKVKELIGRISQTFSQYFSAMKCAGEVDVSIPDNPVRIVVRLQFSARHIVVVGYLKTYLLNFVWETVFDFRFKNCVTFIIS